MNYSDTSNRDFPPVILNPQEYKEYLLETGQNEPFNVIKIETDYGTIQSVVSSEKDHPAIYTKFITKNNNDSAAVIFECNENYGELLIYIWSTEKPEGDPIEIFGFSM